MKKFESSEVLTVERVDIQERTSSRSGREYDQANIDLEGGLRISAFGGTKNYDLYTRLQEGDKFKVRFDGMRILMNPLQASSPTGGEATVQAAPAAALPPRVLLTDAEIEMETFQARLVSEIEQTLLKERTPKEKRKVSYTSTSLLRGAELEGTEEEVEPGFQE